MKRKYLSLETKLAAALLTIVRPDELTGRLVPVISWEAAQLMTAKEIISCFHFDHCVIPHAEGGPDEPWNIDPVPIDVHEHKTRTADIPGIAKRKRVAKDYIEHTRTMQTPRDERPPKQSRWGSRPFPKKEKKNDTTRSRRHP